MAIRQPERRRSHAARVADRLTADRNGHKLCWHNDERRFCGTTNGNNELTTVSSAISNVSQTDVAQAALTVNEQTLQEQALVSLGSDLERIPLINILA
jgi:hypothetical protein